MSDPRARFTGAATVERWQLPEVSGPVIGLAESRRRQDTELQQVLQQAEARGYQAGLERAQGEVRARLAALEERAQRLDAVFRVLARPLDQLDAEVEAQLVQLALAIGKQLVRRELRIEPAQIIAIVRDSIGQLPLAAREVRVHLHPLDAAAVREHLSAGNGERVWTLVEDPTLARGGCLVQSDSSRIDARLESRIAAVAASALGDERATDRGAAGQTS
ncbi:MAG: flagellar assembly protein FliH [Steroidobacteraceae bacterium]